MKSLRYILGGRCRTLDDCLDRARTERPIEVSLELRREEMITELTVLWRLIGRYRWRFPSREVRCEAVYGSFRATDSVAACAEALARGERRLMAALARIQAAGIRVDGVDQCFASLPGNLSEMSGVYR